MTFPFNIHCTEEGWREYLLTIPDSDRAEQWANDLLSAFEKQWIDSTDSLRMLQNMLNVQGDKRAVEWIKRWQAIENVQDRLRAIAYNQRRREILGK